MRENAGYKIIHTVWIGKNREIVIGHDPEAPQPYVCWYCSKGNDYFTGHYCFSYRQALKALADRIIDNYDDIPVEY